MKNLLIAMAVMSSAASHAAVLAPGGQNVQRKNEAIPEWLDANCATLEIESATLFIRKKIEESKGVCFSNPFVVMKVAGRMAYVRDNRLEAKTAKGLATAMYVRAVEAVDEKNEALEHASAVVNKTKNFEATFRSNSGIQERIQEAQDNELKARSALMKAIDERDTLKCVLVHANWAKYNHAFLSVEHTAVAGVDFTSGCSKPTAIP